MIESKANVGCVDDVALQTQIQREGERREEKELKNVTVYGYIPKPTLTEFENFARLSMVLHTCMLPVPASED